MNGFVKIMRGLPGAGKSTYTRNLRIEGVEPFICSADFFHMEGGEYRFQAKNAGAAHKKCFFDFMSGLQLKKPLIVVDNTNVDPIDIAPYYKLAEHFDYDVEIVWVKTPLEVCVHRQVHSVPINTLISMAMSLRKELPRFWRVHEIAA